MSRTVLNFFVDFALLVITTALLATGVVLRFVFPAGTEARGWTLWGWGYDAWSSFQFVLLAVVALVILLHVMLHWSWVCGVVITRLLRRKRSGAAGDDGSQTLYGVATLIVLLHVVGALVAAASLTIRAPV